jgi:hypothetical protein
VHSAAYCHTRDATQRCQFSEFRSGYFVCEELCKMYSLQQRIAIVEAYVCTGSIKETQDIFAGKFPGAGLPARNSIQHLVKKWRTTGSVANSKKNRAPSVRTPAVIADIQARMIRSPTKWTRKLSQETNVSRRSCQRVLQFLQMKPYRMTCPRTEAGRQGKTCVLLHVASSNNCEWIVGSPAVFHEWWSLVPSVRTCEFSEYQILVIRQS